MCGFAITSVIIIFIMIKTILNSIIISTLFFVGLVAPVNAQEKTNIFVFGREDCGFCEEEKSFLENLSEERDDFSFIYLDIDEIEIKQKFIKITEIYELPKATPITLVGNSIIQGFNSAEITGKQIVSILDEQKGKTSFELEKYLEGIGTTTSQIDATCDDKDAVKCVIEVAPSSEIKVPVIGVINYKDFSLFSMATILGFVDGFNPCAMWVLLTFLLVLWQIGNKKKMFQVAGLFIVAETIMYWLILNVWFNAWDFVGLDKIITPTVGLLAIGGGIYFLRRYYKNRKKLTCDVTSADYQHKTEEKIKDLIRRPMTLLTAVGIIGVAFSVNIIEFACSVGIPQAFTKVLELNNLSFISEQFYILLYTLSYMIDDFVIFGLALYGFDKFYTVGQKYSNLSSLVGGILMLILGTLLLFDPSILVF